MHKEKANLVAQAKEELHETRQSFRGTSPTGLAVPRAGTAIGLIYRSQETGPGASELQEGSGQVEGQVSPQGERMSPYRVRRES